MLHALLVEEAECSITQAEEQVILLVEGIAVPRKRVHEQLQLVIR